MRGMCKHNRQSVEMTISPLKFLCSSCTEPTRVRLASPPPAPTPLLRETRMPVKMLPGVDQAPACPAPVRPPPRRSGAPLSVSSAPAHPPAAPAAALKQVTILLSKMKVRRLQPSILPATIALQRTPEEAPSRHHLSAEQATPRCHVT